MMQEQVAVLVEFYESEFLSDSAREELAEKIVTFKSLRSQKISTFNHTQFYQNES